MSKVCVCGEIIQPQNASNAGDHMVFGMILWWRKVTISRIQPILFSKFNAARAPSDPQEEIHPPML